MSFDDVADHLEDFVRHDRSSAETVDRLAGFLADLENVRHDHDEPARDGGASRST